ncbi:MAG: 30S ribosomal protein S20 [Candidatus Methylacidiphilales bacterium]
MANSPSAEKRARVSERRRDINRRQASKARTVSRALKQSIVAGADKQEAAKKVPSVQSAVDKAVKTGSMKKGTANRIKSRIAKALK